jgi:hypothetical protein
VKKCVVNNQITFNDYMKCLFQNESLYAKQNLFRSEKHELYTIVQNKLCLSAKDDKRFIRNDGINTYAWGHKNIDVTSVWYKMSSNIAKSS